VAPEGRLGCVVASLGVESTRIDKWLCAVRVYKTRSMATAACEGGHVEVNDKAAKPSSVVRVGDRVVARVEHRDRLLEVVRVIDKRVGAAVAAECFIDSTPAVEREPYVPVFARDAGAGRPTKRDRRDLDRLRD
jgi:ribosome-associated heat shock protein Hsp15